MSGIPVIANPMEMRLNAGDAPLDPYPGALKHLHLTFQGQDREYCIKEGCPIVLPLEYVVRPGSPVAPTPAVILSGRNSPAIVHEKKKTLTAPQYDVIEALLAAKPLGLTKDGIERVRTDARSILKRLMHDPDWRKVIHMALIVGGRYRID
jgi:hypothetical protein